MKLPVSYYYSNSVVALAKDLCGKFLMTRIGGVETGGMITETEAYAGISDKASHAFGNRRTKRTEVMYRQGGCCYVYFCYGIHYLFNVVTGEINNPHAVLIRGLFPLTGLETMLERTGKRKAAYSISNGPGKLTKALGITLAQNGNLLTENVVWIEDRKVNIKKGDIQSGSRIGVGYAGEDALLPYRFLLDYQKYIHKKTSRSAERDADKLSF
ncbi:MAG: DNA-3-methyladenine glycosylase [Bacteroidales bacterium]|nr:DNA-3-methyladenine glycosylase [Bacteroidales bacterium]